MYRTCLFCNADLGTNERIESFPVGRRLAFDARTGRLWVVCRHCARWNLSPIDERWEAIEQAERLFRETPLRASTDNIGLARLRDGTDLVRIGLPQRPEMAAWRYGDQFGRRRRRHALTAAGTAAFALGLVYGAPLIGAAAPIVLVGGMFGSLLLRTRQRVGVVAIPGEHPILVRTPDLKHAMLVANERSWGIAVTGTQARDGAEWWQPTSRRVERTLNDDAARWAAATLLPRVNATSAPRRVVRDAVGLLATAGSAGAVFDEAARDMLRRFRHGPPVATEVQHLSRLPTAIRLALEMAAHEDTERRAMEGELAALERAWRDADQIAKIADAL